MKFNALVQLHWNVKDKDSYVIRHVITPILLERFPDRVANDVKVMNLKDGTTVIGFLTENGVLD